MKKFMNELIKVDLGMYKLFLFFTTIILAVTSSCKSQNVTATEVKQNNSPITEILRDNYSGYKKEQLILIKDKKALQSFFGKINRTRKPGLTIPFVDFNTHFYMAWCSGETRTSGSELVLKKQTARQLVFEKNKILRSKNNTVVISPVVLYKVEASVNKSITVL